jgi:hypothetical protein
MSGNRWATALAPCVIGVVIIAASLSLAFALHLGTAVEVTVVVISIPQAVWWTSFARNRLLGREADGAFRVVAHPLAASLASGTGELEARLRGTARTSLVALVVIELVAIGLTVPLHPWLYARDTGSGLEVRLMPLIAGVLAAIVLLKVNRAARGAAKIVGGPPSTVSLTTGFRRLPMRRVRYVARLRLTPDDHAPVAELDVVYTNPKRYLYVTKPESATVYGSLEPGTPAVAVIARGMFVGRIRG